MDTIKEFEQLTESQKEEFSRDISELGISLIANGHLNSVQQVTSWQHMLKDEVYLHAEMNFKLNPKTQKVDGKILKLKRFATRGEYFKSVYETKSKSK